MNLNDVFFQNEKKTKILIGFNPVLAVRNEANTYTRVK